MSRDLSGYQKKRIRSAGADTLARMVHQEAYWTRQALLLILDRVEDLTNESPEEGEAAARAALQVLGRLVDPHPDLQALALSAHGTALRTCGHHDAALLRYEEALAIPGISRQARCGALTRCTVALVFKKRIEDAMDAIQSALRLLPEDITALGVRSWARLVAGDHKGTLEDCLRIFEKADPQKNRRSYLAAVVNATAVLRLEAFEPQPALVAHLQESVDACSRHLPQSGSSFYSLALVRGLLYRAEALVLGQQGRYRDGIKLLWRAFKKLADRFPDDAFFAALDLAYFYAHTDEPKRAAQACNLILETSERLPYQPNLQGLVVVRAAVDRGTLSDRQAIEMRSLLMPHLI